MNASDEELASVLLGKGLMEPVEPKFKIEDLYAMVADKQDLEMDVDCSNFLKELFTEKPVDWMDDGMDEILCAKPPVDNSWADDDMDAILCRAAKDVEEGLQVRSRKTQSRNDYWLQKPKCFLDFTGT